MGIEARIAEKRIAQRKRVRAIAIAVLICMVATGCASKYGAQTTQVTNYKECYNPIAQLREAESDFNKTVAAGAILGAVGGAVIGGLVSGKPQGILAGAAVGAAAGGGLGYAAAKQNQIKDDQKRLESYRKDIGTDSEGLDRAKVAAMVASDCYDKQFQGNVEKFKAGQMSKQEFTERYTEIKAGMAEASVILGKVTEGAKKKEEQYSAALASEAAKAGKPVPEPTVPVSAAADMPESTAPQPAPQVAQTPTQEPKPAPAKAPPKLQPAKTATSPKPATAQVASAKPTGAQLQNMSDELQTFKNKASDLQDSNTQISSRMEGHRQIIADLMG
jgi:uncharacterized protein YcfJ